ncbi:MAG: aldehyde dehydrogenase family protein, partial [Candidatus Thiodiazotropha sp.]
MTSNNSTQLLDPSQWRGRIFTGSWTEAQGGAYQVIEPATGEVLAEAGMANAADITQAAASASAVRKGWTDMPPREKAMIFRRAADILQSHLDELAPWVVRETGAIPPKGQLEVR